MKLKFASLLLIAGLLLGMTAPAYAQKSLSPEDRYKGWEVNGGISVVPYFNLLLVYLFMMTVFDLLIYVSDKVLKWKK